MKEGGVRVVLASNIREVVFGIEDSLVSTFGAVTGVAAGSGQSNLVILSGLVLVVVEAISMAAGSYLSSKAATQLSNKERPKRPQKTRHQSPWLASTIMFLFYLLGGLLILAPYIILPLNTALWVAAVIASLALFSLGFWKATIAGVPKVRSGLEMVAVSFIAGTAGIIIGTLAKYIGLA